MLQQVAKEHGDYQQAIDYGKEKKRRGRSCIVNNVINLIRIQTESSKVYGVKVFTFKISTLQNRKLRTRRFIMYLLKIEATGVSKWFVSQIKTLKSSCL